MKQLNKVALALATAGLLASGVAQAALNDRGGGLLYDDVLKVTWLQDANYAMTTGFATDGGRMDWATANTWASSLNISRFAGESLTGWRLPVNTPVGPDWNYNHSYDGSTDYGYNITSPHSELAYMYYVNLGLKAKYSTSGAPQTDYGIFGDGTGFFGGQANVGLVRNLQSGTYWSGTSYSANPLFPDWAKWVMSTIHGQQGDRDPEYLFRAWPVLPGDVAVAAIPEPETYSLMLAGLGLVGFIARRRSNLSV